MAKKQSLSKRCLSKSVAAHTISILIDRSFRFALRITVSRPTITQNKNVHEQLERSIDPRNTFSAMLLQGWGINKLNAESSEQLYTL